MLPVAGGRPSRPSRGAPLLWRICAGAAPRLLAFAVAALLPPLHVFCLWLFWQNYSRQVDRSTCTCSCWDTVFKGTYESGIASYKHFYFNATENTFKIWLMVAGFLVILYECVRWLASLWLTARLRCSMALLFFSSLFSHYYSWWIYINYYNDEFYSQWNHQLIFTITELISTCVVLWLSSLEHSVTLLPAMLISMIGVYHVIASSRDQFVLNVLQGEGHAHQVVRDIGFMIPDLLHIIVPLFNLRRRSFYVMW
ncbi:uncharacterized protein LOC143915860 [Arctopsyche grandis]|uniref:uncharacterized protein LOC143915860 n=1 Tax=Arctopsyche grandis TaxID=121162 RepID=UPI00406D780A